MFVCNKFYVESKIMLNQIKYFLLKVLFVMFN